MVRSLGKLDSPRSILDDGAKVMLLVLSVAALLLCLTYQFLAVTYRYPLDYGEAPLIDQAMRLASGQSIYRADISTPPYVISNYPPLYVLVLAGSVKLFGPAFSFIVGRVVSMLSAWVSALCIAFIVNTATRDRFAALSAGLIFLAFPFVVYWSPLARIDLFALALSLSALTLVVARPIASKRRMIAAALLLVGAIFTRQSYALAAPLAAFVWLWVHDRRRALSLAAMVGLSTLLLFMLFNWSTHGGFYFNIVTANVNEFDFERLRSHLRQFREAAFIPLFFGGLSVLLIRPLHPLWPLTTAYLFGAALSALTIGKIGSNINYFLELCAAVSLAAGAVVAWSRSHLTASGYRAALLVVLALGVGRMMQITLRDYTQDLRGRRAAINEIGRLNMLLAETPGPILADEYMGLLTLQGRRLTIQPFEVTQLVRLGKWNQAPLLDSIRKKEFAAIVIDNRPVAKQRWTPEMLDMISSVYVLADVAAGSNVYKPF